MIFYEHEHDNQSINKIALAILNDQQEEWLTQQIKEINPEVVTVKISSPEEDLNGYESIIILRKNKIGGFRNPEQLAKKFLKQNPEGRVLYIVGMIDEEGQRQVEEIQKLTSELYLAFAEKGKMGPDSIREQLEKMYGQQIEEKINLIQVQGAKGGTGVTTLVAHLANHFAKVHPKVLVCQKRNSLQHHHLDQNVDTVQEEHLTNSAATEYGSSYHAIILDEVTIDESLHNLAQRILVIDGSQESIANSRNYEGYEIVLNHAIPDIMPVKTVEDGLNASIKLTINTDRSKFIQSSLTGDMVIEDIESLISS